MVSTRQMTIGNNGQNEGTSTGHSHSEQPSLRLSTRNGPGTSSGLTVATCSSSQGKALQTQQKSLELLDLPQEIIEKIFKNLTFKNICQIRLVNRYVDRICGGILNTTFQRLQTKMLQRFKDIKKKMPRRESARRSHFLASESDIIETLHMRLNLLQMSFGKHIERKHVCFFPGEILDEVYQILHYIRVTPKLDIPYKVTDELFDLSTMAMEYFKEKIEPTLPEIAYFTKDFSKFSGHFPNSPESETAKDSDQAHDGLDNEDLVEIIPQSNMVLRKRIRKIKQGMKRYNSQLSMLSQDLRTCKRKTSEQQKLTTELQKQLTDQQKQTVEYATRLDEYDKKNEEMSRKFSTLLQELNKCKTELQYWRCKSPAVPAICPNCGTEAQQNDLEVLINQEAAAASTTDTLSEFETLMANEAAAGQAEPSVPVVEVAAPTPSGSKSPKRKAEDLQAVPEDVVKKTRRYTRIRSKRAKV